MSGWVGGCWGSGGYARRIKRWYPRARARACGVCTLGAWRLARGAWRVSADEHRARAASGESLRVQYKTPGQPAPAPAPAPAPSPALAHRHPGARRRDSGGIKIREGEERAPSVGGWEEGIRGKRMRRAYAVVALNPNRLQQGD